MHWDLLQKHSKELFPPEPGWLRGKEWAIRVFYRGSPMWGKTASTLRQRGPVSLMTRHQFFHDRHPSCLPSIRPYQTAILPLPMPCHVRLRSAWHLCLLALSFFGSGPLRHKAFLLINLKKFFKTKICYVAQAGLKFSHFSCLFPIQE